MPLTKYKRQKNVPSPIPEEGSQVESADESYQEERKEKPNVLHYSLSDKEFINKGWTVLPSHKLMKKEKIYLPIDQKSSNDWICNNESKTLLTYRNGEKLAEFKQKSVSRIFYKHGKTAIDINNFEIKGHTFQRYVLRNDEDDSLLAIFDTLGRGAVTDEFGKTRLKYNQLEGMLSDSAVGTPRTWNWHYDCEKPEYENVMFDTYIHPPDEDITQVIQREIARGGDIGLSKLFTDQQHKDNASCRTVKLSVNNSERESNSSRIRLKPEVVVKNRSAKSKLTLVGETISNNKSKTQSKERVSTISKTNNNNNQKNERKCSKFSMESQMTIFQNIKVFHQQQIKPMTLKINNYLTLKIISRKNMYVTFLHDCWMMKIDLGIELTNECIESYLVEPEFASSDYEIVLSKINKFLQAKNKNKRKELKDKTRTIKSYR